MFFTFDQNNSGGSFGGPATYVIIEANDADEANYLAERNGIYFDGCVNGQDCDCCGDRWSRQWREDGYETPQIYGTEVEEYVGKDTYSLRKGLKIPAAIVVYKDGTKKEYR